MKRDKLYTVNQWNKSLLTKSKNIFPDGGVIYSPTGFFDRQGQWNSGYSSVNDLIEQGLKPLEYTGSLKSVGDGTYRDINNLPTLKPVSAPLPKAGTNGLTDLQKAGIGIAGQVGNTLGHRLLSNGLSSTAGDMTARIGEAVGNVVSMFNPVAGAVVNVASGVIGGGLNALIGSKINDENVARINSEIGTTTAAGRSLAGLKNKNTIVDALGNINTNIGVSDVGRDGVWAHKAADLRDNLELRALNAKDYAINGLITGLKNADRIDDERAQFNSAAYGGFLDNLSNDYNMGAIDYGFMQDYLTMKGKQVEARNKLGGIASVPNTLAYGGIEIKHPGRLTELKKRTGKTEAELWAEGRPEVRKMITFARNSRRWSKYALGGYLKGNIYDIPEEEVNRLIAAGYEIEYL